MTAAEATILGALVGALAGVLGQIVGQALGRSTETLRWRRETRTQTYIRVLTLLDLVGGALSQLRLASKGLVNESLSARDALALHRTELEKSLPFLALFASESVRVEADSAHYQLLSISVNFPSLTSERWDEILIEWNNRKRAIRDQMRKELEVDAAAQWRSRARRLRSRLRPATWSRRPTET